MSNYKKVVDIIKHFAYDITEKSIGRGRSDYTVYKFKLPGEVDKPVKDWAKDHMCNWEVKGYSATEDSNYYEYAVKNYTEIANALVEKKEATPKENLYSGEQDHTMDALSYTLNSPWLEEKALHFTTQNTITGRFNTRPKETNMIEIKEQLIIDGTTYENPNTDLDKARNQMVNLMEVLESITRKYEEQKELFNGSVPTLIEEQFQIKSDSIREAIDIINMISTEEQEENSID